jgi:hypothetical protein
LATYAYEFDKNGKVVVVIARNGHTGASSDASRDEALLLTIVSIMIRGRSGLALKEKKALTTRKTRKSREKMRMKFGW